MKRALLFVALSSVLFVSAAARADHGNNQKVHWGKKNVKVVDSVQSAWEPELTNGVASWNDGVKKVELTVVDGIETSDCGYIKGKVRVCNGSYGNSGLWENVAGYATYRYALPSRHFTKAKIELNDTNTDSTLQQAVTTHELGHILGLNHRPDGDVTSCMTTAVLPTQTDPDDHDYAEVNRLHRHLPHGAAATVADSGEDGHTTPQSHDGDVTVRRVGNEIEVRWRLSVPSRGSVR